MESWKHCAKKWYSIDIGLAVSNIKRGAIVLCKLNDEEHLFNTSSSVNPAITPDMVSDGDWSVYTWAD